MKNMENRFKVADGVYASIWSADYAYGDCKCFGLTVSESSDEDCFVGEPWTNVSVNLPSLERNEIALDNDFLSFSTSELVEDVLRYLTVDSLPHRVIPSGFVTFPVFKLREEHVK